MMRLQQVANAVNGKFLATETSNVLVDGVTIDSRKECSKQLFIALNGEHFDAHDFIDQARLNGANALIVERPVDTSLPYVQVKNSHQALTDLAAWWRSRFDIPVIGITGSVGKTTVKEMLGQIFASTGSGLHTQGNLNNEIGVPLTLLRLKQCDQYAIIEMGMNNAGEISRLSALARPTIALINNAAAAHLEGLGSVEAVAQAKGEIFSGLADDGIAIINADDQYAPMWQELAEHHKRVSFGLSQSADVRANYQNSANGVLINIQTPQESFELSLSLYGQHSVMNVLAAVAVAQSANVSVDAIIKGLENYRPLSGRMSIRQFDNVTLIDDSYNANPASMLAAIKVLAEFENTTLIVGDMGELGKSCEKEHQRLGELAAKYGVGCMLAVGEYAELAVKKFSGQSAWFSDQAELLSYLQKQSSTLGTVLVKGSRSAKMENVVEHLAALVSADGLEKQQYGTRGLS